MSTPNANVILLPPPRRMRACASATGITAITTATGITRPVRPVVFV